MHHFVLPVCLFVCLLMLLLQEAGQRSQGARALFLMENASAAQEQREVVAGVRQTQMSFEWSDGTGESDFNQLLGKRVRIIGLTGRPELNGCLGAYALHIHTACTKLRVHSLLRRVERTLHVPASSILALVLRWPSSPCIAGTVAECIVSSCQLYRGNYTTAYQVQAEFIAGMRRRAGPVSCWCSMSKAAGQPTWLGLGLGLGLG